MTNIIDLIGSLQEVHNNSTQHLETLTHTHKIASLVATTSTANDSTVSSTSLFTPGFGAGIGAGCARFLFLSVSDRWKGYRHELVETFEND